MMIPSIDVMGGRTVQLVGGRELRLDAGDPRPLAERFGRIGEVAVIDLDAALGQGSNASLIHPLLDLARCRVGGGIRSYEAALHWLDAGAARVILGTAAEPALLQRLPRERVTAALDADHGEVVVKGWRERTGRELIERVRALRPYVGGFLVTFVEREGRLQGVDMERARQIIAAAAPVRVTIAGGVSTTEEIAELDRAGADAQVGMALYTGKITLADSVAAILCSDRDDGLWPTVVVDERGVALGLAWSNAESLSEALETGRGVYWSRRRGLWRKGESSGAVQTLLAVDVDCDRDALRFTVRQSGAGFCHRGDATCWGECRGSARLERVLAGRRDATPDDSYSGRLFRDPTLLRAKLIEEAGELASADSPEHVAEEAADLSYFLQCALSRTGVSLAQVDRVLDRRALRVTRRAGDAKPEAPRE